MYYLERLESKDGNVGIVTGVNKKTINITYTSHRSVQGPPELFKTTDIPFEQARSKRKKSNIVTDFWYTVYSGYFKNKGEVHEVVIGQITRGNVI